MLNHNPPPPPVILVQQPYVVTYPAQQEGGPAFTHPGMHGGPVPPVPMQMNYPEHV